MVRPRDLDTARQIDEGLSTYHSTNCPLPGIQAAGRRDSFIAQITESMRRVRYVSVIRERGVSERRADPNSELFDPLKAAVHFQSQGEADEAFWMVFLFVHFGLHRSGGWRYAREVYGRLGDPNCRWDWATTSTNVAEFRIWLHEHCKIIQDAATPGGFGNHRKYESLDAYSDRGTGEVFDTYVDWVKPPRTHVELMNQAWEDAGHNPREAFRALYISMDKVARFGRTARFDYLTMISKLGLASIEADSTYMQGATGPLRGARLLFELQEGPARLDQRLVELAAQLSVGMQVMEDALCNWQKSPDAFVPFRG